MRAHTGMMALAVVALVAGRDAAGQRGEEPELTVEMVRARSAARLDGVEVWVGTWTGKARWNHCASDKTTRVHLELPTSFTSDGASVMDGLGQLAWQAADGDLVASAPDVVITLSPTRKGAKLVVEAADGCVGKASLKRATSGMASCDSLRALATIEDSCATSDTRSEALARVNHAWRKWSKLAGKKKRRQAKTCAAEAEAARDRIVSSCVVGIPSNGSMPAPQYPFNVDPPPE